MNDIKWWIGVVENTNDKEKRGRIQVRILGIHTTRTDKSEQEGDGIPTEDLPWAQPCMPLTFGGIGNATVPPPGVQEGAWVIGISLDGDAYNKLLVLGVISIAMDPLATNPYESNMNSLTDSSTVTGKKYSGFNIDQSCLENAGNIIEQLESGGNDNAYNPSSKSGAWGPMQLIGSYITDHFNKTKSSNPEQLKNFEDSTGIQLSTSNVTELAKTNPTLNRILGRGYYKWILENPNYANGDYVLASFAYCEGPGALNNALKTYGTPPNDLSYEEFAQKTSSKYPTGSKRVTDFMNSFGDSGKSVCLDKSEVQNV